MSVTGLFRRRSRLTNRSLHSDSWLQKMDAERQSFFREEVATAIGSGMRPGVFAKVGDSNFAAYNALFGLGCVDPVWDVHRDLEPVMRRYRQIDLPPGMDIPFFHSPDAVDRKPWNSFSRMSAATSMGIVAEHLLVPPSQFERPPADWKTDPDCRPDESLIECEVRITRPVYCLIQIGTNGQSYGRSPERTAEMFGGVVETVRELGSVPIGLTILPQLDHELTPGRWEFARKTNEVVCDLAWEARIPLFNQWLALTSADLVNFGLIEYDREYFDGFHLETYGGFDQPGAVGRSVDFRPEALRYGANFRNLLTLRVLRELDDLAGI